MSRLAIVTIDYEHRYNIGNYHLNAEVERRFSETRYLFLDVGFDLNEHWDYFKTCDLIFINRPLRKAKHDVEGEMYRSLCFKGLSCPVLLFDTDAMAMKMHERTALVESIGVTHLALGNNNQRVHKHREEGNGRGRLACMYFPFGVNTDHFWDFDRVREIPAGFIGSYRNPVYVNRKAMVFHLRDRLGKRFFWKRMIKEEYVQYLNNIKVFTLANDNDKGFFMKHLETMACGCLLVCERTPLLEYLGFQDGRDLLVWDSLRECEDAVLYYSMYEEERSEIVERAKARVQRDHTWEVRVDALFEWLGGRWDGDCASGLH